MGPALRPVRTLTRQFRVCNSRQARYGNPSLLEPLPPAVCHGKSSSGCGRQVTFMLQRIRDGYPEPTGEMRITCACILKASEGEPDCLVEKPCARRRGQHQQRFNGAGNLLICEFVVAVPPLPLRRDETGCGQ